MTLAAALACCPAFKLALTFAKVSLFILFRLLLCSRHGPSSITDLAFYPTPQTETAFPFLANVHSVLGLSQEVGSASEPRPSPSPLLLLCYCGWFHCCTLASGPLYRFFSLRKPSPDTSGPSQSRLSYLLHSQ